MRCRLILFPLTVIREESILGIERLGGSGAAKTFKFRQVREEAAVRRLLWVLSECRPGRLSD
jgi:hypothetical protein